MKSDLNLQAITAKFQGVLDFLRKYKIALILLIIAGLFGFMIYRIGMLANAEPTQDAIDEKLNAVVRPRIDPKSIKAIEDLQSQHIDINSYFSGRDNPFQE
jgi:hypothetical protein